MSPTHSMFFQVKEALHYTTIMGFGYISRTFEIDFSGSNSNEADFELAVIQEGGPQDTGAEIKFKAEFKSHLGVS